MNTPKPHTLLASLAITTLLLTACGSTQQAANLPTPETSSSATAVPTATDTATNSATTDPAQPSASPSQAYSGGSKAPEGEYRPADEFGPAQNVPKPVAPVGMNVESPGALILFVDYWNDLRNYANQTGDASCIRNLVDESFEQEQGFYDALEEIYASGGWVVGGESQLHYEASLLVAHGNGIYSLGSNIKVNDSVLWYAGEATYSDNSESFFQDVELQLKYSNNAWKITGAKKVEA